MFKCIQLLKIALSVALLSSTLNAENTIKNKFHQTLGLTIVCKNGRRTISREALIIKPNQAITFKCVEPAHVDEIIVQPKIISEEFDYPSDSSVSYASDSSEEFKDNGSPRTFSITTRIPQATYIINKNFELVEPTTKPAYAAKSTKTAKQAKSRK